VVIIEDADRFSHEAVNVLLKVLEEPPQQLVWVLCAPSQEDVLPTIRSRTRSVQLRTPTTSEVSQALQDRYGIDPAMAAFAARASQGHIGRARALATDEGARIRRQEVLRSPATLRDLAACFAAADDLLSAATEDAQSISTELDASETADIRQTYGVSAQGLPPAKTNRLANSALKAAEKTQKSRRTRLIRDQVDRALVDLIAYYRDVLILQTGAAIPLINDEMRAQIQREASSADMPDTILRWEAIESARAMVAASGALPLVLEALMVELKDPRISQRT
jgi:DNA polymerase-3 subunit delta'